MKKIQFGLLMAAIPLLFGACADDDNPYADVPDEVTVVSGVVTVKPYEYYKAFRNPMKGLREFFGPGYDTKRSEYPYPFGTLIKEYMHWNMMESVESDNVDQVIAYSNHRWEGVEEINMKVVPRPFIVWMEPWHGGVAKNTHTTNPDDLNGWHWPFDFPGESGYSTDPTKPITGGYFDPNFPERISKLVAKLGEAWDNDPRVAYVEMGLIGEWGEHHDPDITTVYPPHDQPDHVANRTWVPGLEKVLGDAFKAAFKNKKVMVRYAYEFKDYENGIYWDSWAMGEEQQRGYDEMIKLGDRWKTQPIGGEITWNWGDLMNKGFDSFEDVVADEPTRTKVIEQIRNLHCNHLGGVTWANFKDANFMVNASSVQKAMGYRYLIREFGYPAKIEKGVPFNVSFTVVNSGSSPFYYDWPVEIALLDAKTHEKVWARTLSSAKISEWMPGDKWSSQTNKYSVPASENTISEDLTLDTDLPAGKYIVSIACLDPAGMLPSLRFAVRNYYNGGRHPMGYVGVGQAIETFNVGDRPFDDIQNDKTLKYVVNK